MRADEFDSLVEETSFGHLLDFDQAFYDLEDGSIDQRIRQNGQQVVRESLGVFVWQFLRHEE